MLKKSLSRLLKTTIFAVILPLAASAAPAAWTPEQPALGIAPAPVLQVSSHGGMQYGACFYSRYNYQGSKLCYGPAELKRLPVGLDKHFRSIKLIGDVRVSLCSREGLRGKCMGYDRSVRELARAVANKTYSVRIYRPEGGYGNGGNTGNGYGTGGTSNGYGSSNGYGN